MEERIGKYQIVKMLGKGAAGQVFCARQDQIERLVALKILLPHVIEKKPHFLERFAREARLIAKLSHPNIIALFEIGQATVTDQGQALELHYYTMEYVDNATTLHDLFKQGHSFTFEQKLSITEQLLDGLALAHRAGVMHRDLKPMNVLVDAEGTPKILDFGVSKSYEDEDLTVAGMVIGSPPYMSPEQARAKKVTVQSDIFSFGVMTYELFAGERPLQAPSRKDYIFDRQNYPNLPADRMPKPLTHYDPDFPPRLADMIFSMLEAHPDRRPSAHRLREQLALFRKDLRRDQLELELAKQGQIKLYGEHWRLPAACGAAIFLLGLLLKLVAG